MTTVRIRSACALAAAGIFAGQCFMASASAQSASGAPAPAAPVRKGAVVNTKATGTFDVKLEPQPADEKTGGSAIGRLTIEKTFHGGLEGASRGQMLAASTATSGSAGYVAIEQVTGMLDGRAGTFALQHSGTMTRGAPELTITVVPDSGTGQLIGLAGKMTIRITDGKHFYELEYMLPQPPV
ncbi:MAG: DUF3224 domain-containing protein [Acidobacteriota bacterium]